MTTKGAKAKEEREAARAARLATVNSLLEAIANRGLHFFRSQSGHLARFEFRGTRLYFIDKYLHTPRKGLKFLEPVERAIWTHQELWEYSHEITEGGTLKALLGQLQQYIMHGTQLHPRAFGPYPSWASEGDPWDYGIEAMQEIAQLARELGITRLPEGPTNADTERDRGTQGAQ